MNIKRGDIWLATLDPTQGSEQAGTRPVVIFQNETILQYSITVVAIPLTTNLRRLSLPTCVLMPQNEKSVKVDSVALCHQIRVLDKTRLVHKLGELGLDTIENLDKCVLFTLGIVDL